MTLQNFLFYIFLMNHCSVQSLEEPLVTIDSGVISGSTGISNNGRKYFSFEGIPYAEPPVGVLRFAAAVPVKPWEGVKNTSKPGSECLQLKKVKLPQQDKVTGDEDCLFINVYTPKLPNKDEEEISILDVLVYIHPGSHTYGSGSAFGPEYLMDEDMVYITFNFRLGILGFLSTGDSVVSGNNGLKDQVLVLKWIQRNIQSFGGNPDSITLVGFSSGGSSVQYHYLSPMSKGLFHRGISLSGTAVAARHQVKMVPQKSKEVAKMLNCPTQSSLEMVECLREQDGTLLVNVTKVFQEWLYFPDIIFGPIVEINSSSAFLAKHPVEVIVSGEAQDLPWVSTGVTHEGLAHVAYFAPYDEYLAHLNSAYRTIFPPLLEYEYTVEQSDKGNVSDRIRGEYFGDKSINKETIPNLIQALSEWVYVIPLQLAVQLQSKYSTSAVYSYIFGYRGKHSTSEEASGTDINWGVRHGDDNAYFLKWGAMDTNSTEEDRQMRKFFLKFLTSFSKTGVPLLPEELNVSWTPQEKGGKTFTYLYIEGPENMEMRTTEDIGNIKFWKTLPIHEYEDII